MNVFVLCTGRCGSKTFIRACRHATNFSAGHETRVRRVGPDRFAYPQNHIEADNRLSWLLGRLDAAYGDSATYVHLTRYDEATALSFLSRYDRGIMQAYHAGILLDTKEAPISVCRDYVETVNANIAAFLRDKSRVMTMRWEYGKQDFQRFWDWIGAEGDPEAALAEWDIEYNDLFATRRPRAPSQVEPGSGRKEQSELGYWQSRKRAEGTLSNDHFAYFYTQHFGLDPSHYTNKRVLDIGCGPRGSLEWATMAAERVGLDPLADTYRHLGTDAHDMRYVAASAESIPFPDNYFDVVCSFNSLDHVDNLELAVAEIVRVTAVDGLFLLLTDIHERPTVLEPQSFSWDVVDRFQPTLRLVDTQHYEKRAGMYESIRNGVDFDHSNESRRYGVLSAKFVKP